MIPKGSPKWSQSGKQRDFLFRVFMLIFCPPKYTPKDTQQSSITISEPLFSTLETMMFKNPFSSFHVILRTFGPGKSRQNTVKCTKTEIPLFHTTNQQFPQHGPNTNTPYTPRIDKVAKTLKTTTTRKQAGRTYCKEKAATCLSKWNGRRVPRSRLEQ